MNFLRMKPALTLYPLPPGEGCSAQPPPYFVATDLKKLKSWTW